MSAHGEHQAIPRFWTHRLLKEEYGHSSHKGLVHQQGLQDDTQGALQLVSTESCEGPNIFMPATQLSPLGASLSLMLPSLTVRTTCLGHLLSLKGPQSMSRGPNTAMTSLLATKGQELTALWCVGSWGGWDPEVPSTSAHSFWRGVFPPLRPARVSAMVLSHLPRQTKPLETGHTGSSRAQGPVG